MDNNKKQLIISIIKFLRNEVGSYNDEEMTESLEVAVQCLETAYGINSSVDNGLDLMEIFHEVIQKKETSAPPSTKSVPDDVKQKADSLKNNGNELMKAEKYAEAIDSYTQAINLDPNNAVYYCNRAAAYTKLLENKKAIDDCEKAISIEPTYSKAYARMGLIYLNGKNYQKAAQCYENAHKLEPTNHSYKQNLDIANSNLKTPGPQAAANPLAGLDLNALLNNPAVMNMAQSFMQNPQMQNMFANLMGGGGPPAPSGRVRNTATETDETQNTDDFSSGPSTGSGGLQMPPGLDFANIMNATQQFAEQMRQQNPEVVENLRRQFQEGSHPDMPPANKNERNDENM